MAEQTPYPECEKLSKHLNEINLISDFFAYLNNNGIVLAKWSEKETHLVPTSTNVTPEKLAAGFFGIDMGLVEKERRDITTSLKPTSTEIMVKNSEDGNIGSDVLGEPYSTDLNKPLAGMNGESINGVLVEFLDDGYVRWDKENELEPKHLVKKGDQMWLGSFQEDENGTYSHETYDMNPRSIIETDCRIQLIYESWDAPYDQPLFDRSRQEIQPDVT